MSDKKVALIIDHMLEKAAPSEEINLWPALRTQLQTSVPRQERGSQMETHTTVHRRLRLAALITATLVFAIGLFLARPQGKAWAQTIIHLFTRAESDALPIQSFQRTPIPTTVTPDPADINNANLTVSQVEQQAGYRLFKPTQLPEFLSFVGATFDTGKNSARLFYRDGDMNGFVLREEPFQQADDCELCGKVGASAAVEPVQIGDAPGEYVQGVWKLTENGPEWVPDPYLQTIRWQNNGMAFELLYMGSPDNFTKADMIAIAESVK